MKGSDSVDEYLTSGGSQRDKDKAYVVRQRQVLLLPVYPPSFHPSLCDPTSCSFW